ncbi:hypothetical protein F8M41_025947 [Gigaspora margarita]|uniref:Uncharacterized protein n=1 Tax=Gigaspora margarita TaxID=4874 RepID=A0A8H4AZT6_GIGMA|nr:hypothetical protein F8M41_025947 [Gigaspora margarita]
MFEKLSAWNRLPNSITYLKSFIFLDALQLAMLIPVILRYFLNSDDIISTSFTVLYAISYCFKLKLTQGDLDHLQDILIEECHILIELFPKGFKDLSNLHINFYLSQNCKNYGTLVNSNCVVKKMVHKLSKQAVLKTN